MILDRSANTDENAKAVALREFDELYIGDVLQPPARTITRADLELLWTQSSHDRDEPFSAVWVKKADVASSPITDVQDFVFTSSVLFANVVGEAFVAASLVSSSARALRLGDTMHTRLVITNLTRLRATGVVTADVAVRNQRGEAVVQGEHTYLLRLPAARDTADPSTAQVGR